MNNSNVFAQESSIVEGPITGLFPPSETDTDLGDLMSVITAQNECKVLLGDNEVTVVDDPELDVPCVEILGSNAAMTLDTNSILRYIAFHIKNLGKYMTLEVEIVDDAKQYRIFRCSNSISAVRIEMHECHMPLSLTEGWNFLNLDLEDMCQKAFGTGYLSTVQVRVHASCRLLHCYLQDRPFADAELPMHLKVIKEV